MIPESYRLDHEIVVYNEAFGNQILGAIDVGFEAIIQCSRYAQLVQEFTDKFVCLLHNLIFGAIGCHIIINFEQV